MPTTTPMPKMISASSAKSSALPSCTSGNGCFRKVYSNGRKPAANSNWSVEISLDIEWAHAIAPQAKIVLIETPSNNLSDCFRQWTSPCATAASTVSMSWTSGEILQRTQSGQSLRRQRRHVSCGLRRHRHRRRISCSLALRDRRRWYLAHARCPRKLRRRSSLEWQRWRPQPLRKRAAGARTVRHPGRFARSSRRTGRLVQRQPRNRIRHLRFRSASTEPAGWFQVGGTSAGAPQWAALIAITNSQRAAVSQGQPHQHERNALLDRQNQSWQLTFTPSPPARMAPAAFSAMLSPDTTT